MTLIIVHITYILKGSIKSCFYPYSWAQYFKRQPIYSPLFYLAINYLVIFKVFTSLSYIYFFFYLFLYNNMNYGSIPGSPPQKAIILTKAERDLLQSDRPGYGSRTKVEVAFNLVNATVGAGIIGLPFAIARAGFVTGIAASIVVAVLAQIGLYMLIVAGQRVGIYKFAQLVEYLMGRPGYHFSNFMICVQAGGGTVSYFILLGDSLPLLFERYLPQFPILSNRTFILIFVGIVFVSRRKQ